MSEGGGWKNAETHECQTDTQQDETNKGNDPPVNKKNTYWNILIKTFTYIFVNVNIAPAKMLHGVMYATIG